jgi:hypothetical protein
MPKSSKAAKSPSATRWNCCRHDHHVEVIAHPPGVSNDLQQKKASTAFLKKSRKKLFPMDAEL